jgi:hypothetical protein
MASRHLPPAPRPVARRALAFKGVERAAPPGVRHSVPAPRRGRGLVWLGAWAGSNRRCSARRLRRLSRARQRREKGRGVPGLASRP